MLVIAAARGTMKNFNVEADILIKLVKQLTSLFFDFSAISIMSENAGICFHFYV